MNNYDLENELKKAIPYIIQPWPKQTDYKGSRSNFIYKTKLFEDVKFQAELLGLDIIYVMHRWYNFHTSITSEEMFIQNGCLKQSDDRDKEIDIYFKGIPYDVKLTVYPKSYRK